MRDAAVGYGRMVASVVRVVGDGHESPVRQEHVVTTFRPSVRTPRRVTEVVVETRLLNLVSEPEAWNLRARGGRGTGYSLCQELLFKLYNFDNKCCFVFIKKSGTCNILFYLFYLFIYFFFYQELYSNCNTINMILHIP